MPKMAKCPIKAGPKLCYAAPKSIQTMEEDDDDVVLKRASRNSKCVVWTGSSIIEQWFTSSSSKKEEIWTKMIDRLLIWAFLASRLSFAAAQEQETFEAEVCTTT